MKIGKFAKFFAALVTGGLSAALVNQMGLTPEIAGSIVAVITATITWLVPNAARSDA